MSNHDALREALDKLVTHYCCLMDNLGDLPIPNFEKWARDQFKKGSALLEENDYFRALAASKPEPQAKAGEPEAWGNLARWRTSAPPHPWREEWFIAETIYGDRVVLQALEQPHAYDYTTADRTYMKAKNVKRWMQFPESEYTSYATKMHREALAASKPANDDIHSCSEVCDRPECVAAREASKPARQAQGEPEVVAHMYLAEYSSGSYSPPYKEWRVTMNPLTAKYDKVKPLITLQSHREALAAKDAEIAKLREAARGC